MQIIFCILIFSRLAFSIHVNIQKTQTPVSHLSPKQYQTKQQIIKQYGNNSLTMYMPSPQYSIVWLHGHGGTIQIDQHHFSLPESPLFHAARIRFLQAPQRFSTWIKQETTSWYDVKSIDPEQLKKDQNFSKQEIEQSSNFINQQIKEQIQYWKKAYPHSLISPYRRIFLGGMSQGCGMSLKHGLEYKRSLSGIICFSGHLLPFTKLTNLNKTKILLIHGTEDKLLPEKDIKQQYIELLKSPNTIYKSIKGLTHIIVQQELKETTKWILQIVKDFYKQ